MGTQGVEIFAKPVSPDHLSDDPLVAPHISNGILKAAENSKAATKSGPAEATEANKNPLVRKILTACRSDYFPVLLLLAGYTLVAFGAALILLVWLIAHRA
ncbi:hypothetical protein CK228_24685 [Mesorhizobium sp. WSM4312]|uniref:hypothetical protein n=1 Tax=unclassified Mesorhizobium TaxID=325217 RepID=UPI000BAEEB2C|nr:MULTISPECIES: hypothetical protein [unclassified Mesorhizobium]PBB65935.1 hypothetical protein CK228_24685 [Mesorhizobium sp. WSM4312]PBC20071.1 hypothetical protein CK226_25170 [Mesorhizobium sp. WSM4311]TRC71235.1 hypothetical protein FJV80_33665 [Mesorhizobium sp. WSM4310]TRC77907.1 hypothetical protein FJV81_09745 [Mesorhizobium sp. WSM4315]TRC78699.1 hypothetical protein FJV83_30155 [Mesorhizobium sp. WSM4307]